MRNGMPILAVAGLAMNAFGQGVTLHFESDTPAVEPGGTAHWVVRASFTGYPDPTAYVGGFRGDFLASDPSFGNGMNFVSHMHNNSTIPVFDGASILGLYALNAALFGTMEPGNPLDLFEFDTVSTPGAGSLSYGVDGVAWIYRNSFIFAIYDEYDESAMTIMTDELVVATDVEPLPGVVVSLRADRTEVILGETVTWTIGVEFTGWDEPGAYVTQIEGNLVTGDPLVGVASEPVSLIGGDTTCRVEGTGLLDLFTGQPVGGPYDTANPIDLATFEVRTRGLGVLEYDLAGRVVVQHPAYAGPYRVRAFGVTSDVVTVSLGGCNQADLAEPFGVFDQNDIAAFVGFFLGTHPVVDYDMNGLHDLADILGFVEAFTAGCP